VTRIALIGAGMWAPRLAAAAQRAGLELVAVHARSRDARESLAERCGCRAAETFDDAIADAEGVLLATPNDVHGEQAAACAAAGRHVFVEKPIADTVEAAERMRDACADVVLMVGHAFRRLGAARATRSVIDEGRLGTVVLAEANFSLPAKLPPQAWRAQRARNPGGPLMQLGIHHVDTLAYLLGPIERTAGRFARVHTAAEIDDVGVATLEFAAGALGVVTGSYVSPHTFSIRLLGSEGVLDYRADLGAVWPAAERVDEVSTLMLDGAPVPFEAHDMLAEELAEFGAAIRGEAAVETGAEEGIAALRAVLDAVGPREAVAP
jgi:1,5-anhydro-D-fructose reductase (1,5-anhydro-D-mannitol-forming)